MARVCQIYMDLLSQLFSTGKVGKQGEILIWLELMISVSIATLTNKKNYYFSLGANGSWMGGYEINGWELNEWQLILLDISLLPHRSLEVLLQHLSLQDVDVRDNEVCYACQSILLPWLTTSTTEFYYSFNHCLCNKQG